MTFELTCVSIAVVDGRKVMMSSVATVTVTGV